MPCQLPAGTDDGHWRAAYRGLLEGSHRPQRLRFRGIFTDGGTDGDTTEARLNFWVDNLFAPTAYEAYWCVVHSSPAPSGPLLPAPRTPHQLRGHQRRARLALSLRAAPLSAAALPRRSSERGTDVTCVALLEPGEAVADARVQAQREFIVRRTAWAASLVFGGLAAQGACPWLQWDAHIPATPPP